MTTFEDQLHDFCNHVLNHLSGDNTNVWFTQRHGLCHNFQLYNIHCKLSNGVWQIMANDLHELFVIEYTEASGFIAAHPFDVTIHDYFDGVHNNTLYTNPDRLRFLTKYSR